MLKISWSDIYRYPLPEGHRFPMEKYDLIPEQLLYEGTITEANLYDPGFARLEDILLTHTPDYISRLQNQTLTPKEIRKTGFPLSERLVRRSFSIAHGTMRNAVYAMQYGVAINGAGGTHHAYADRGEGFCLLNDIAITANWLLANGKINRALVVDLDVHQGNGTAVIFQGDPRVFTFSMHCEANYPLHKEKSDLDIGLPAFSGDQFYLQTLRNTLPRLLDEVEPDIVFYLSGVDILHTDKLGKLACTKEGCKQRDEYVLRLCHENNVPVVISLGGGYSPLIKDIVDAHCNTFRLAQEIWF
ncbi:MAG: histone deacetylase [Bacteroidia bacterium]